MEGEVSPWTIGSRRFRQSSQAFSLFSLVSLRLRKRTNPFMTTFLRFLLKLFFRFRAFNEESLRGPGPMLLTPNHVSWFDWLFLAVCLDDNWRFVTSSHTAQSSWFHRKVMTGRHAFPVETDSPYAVKHMAEYLQKGGKLVLFPEGRLSQTGSLMKLFDGTGFLLFKTGAKV